MVRLQFTVTLNYCPPIFSSGAFEEQYMLSKSL